MGQHHSFSSILTVAGMLRLAGLDEKTEKCTPTNMVTENSHMLSTLKSNPNHYGTYLIANLLHR